MDYELFSNFKFVTRNVLASNHLEIKPTCGTVHAQAILVMWKRLKFCISQLDCKASRVCLITLDKVITTFFIIIRYYF